MTAPGGDPPKSGPALSFPLAPEPSAEAAEAARKLLTGEIAFVKGVVAIGGLPPPDRPEVCFAGRSNVGKSSLINALTGRRSLARASNTPGRTQEINYFDAGGRLFLVDLPGYGFAEAPKATVEKWQRLLKAYLAGRQTLRRAFVLIDARHGVKAVDEEILTLLDRSAVPFQAVLTKADKIGAHERETSLAQVRGALARHPAAYPELIVTSSEKGEGIATLRAVVADFA
ncbi:MAG: ribosome biogenesis GTP-binding protein YihA/YsxC [Paracoccaceae bacterium]